MADLKFDCPKCKQSISCDELWSGHQLACPSCQYELTVPQKPASAPAASSAPGSLVPVPPSAPTPKLGIGRSHNPPAAAPAPAGPRPGAAPIRKPASSGKGGKNAGVFKILKIAAVVIVLGVGGYFGWGLIINYQDKLNAKTRQAEKNSDGGEMGHIANLNNVLDATEPGGRGLGGGGTRGSAPERRSSGPKAIYVPTKGGAGVAGGEDGQKDQPVIPPVYTLEVESAKIPESRVNGMISGTNFVAETSRLDAIPGALVLRLFQGQAMAPDRELLVYLHLKPGETLAGRKWAISKDMKGAGVPQVAKRWKPNPRFAPSLKTYATGYAMQLELDKIADGQLTGKVFLALPDVEQSVAAGVFSAETVVTDATAASAANAAPVVAPGPPPGAVPSGASPMDKRYGKRPGG